MPKYIKSPLNYIGSKYKILDHILPNFPAEINRFVDLFTGSLNVGINVNAKEIYANDRLEYLIDLHSYFQTTPVDAIISGVKKCIDQYSISMSNALGYNMLRNEYNRTHRSIDLFVLSCFSYNKQIRFNNNHEFNMPFGKNHSSYNASTESNLTRFCTALQQKPIVLSAGDFSDFDFSDYNSDDFVYCDPPYLIAEGPYNKDWTAQDDIDLFTLLDGLNAQKIRFALSNVFQHKGITNDYLIEWSKKYHVLYIDKSYVHCSYNSKYNEAKTVEVLVTNYLVEEPYYLVEEPYCPMDSGPIFEL